MKHKIGILGAGTWGMALARMLTVSGNDVQVWSAIEAEVDNLSATRVHPNLPGMVIPQELRFTKSIEEVCTGKDVLLFAVPSVFVRSTAAKARPYIRSGQIIVDVAKGIEPDTLYTMTEILADELSHENGPRAVRLVALSGPTHAEEVALDLPTTIVSASPDMEAAEVVQEVFSNTCMRVYTNSDIKGVELSGAMKNVIAALTEGFAEVEPGVTVSYDPTGSGAGITGATDKTLDIGLSSRALKDDEKSAVDGTVVALDGIAIVVNKDSKVADLTVEQLKKMFTGEISNWKDVGGDDGDIVLVGREAGSGTRDGFESIVDVKDSCKYAQELTATGAVISAVEANPLAIGYASLSAVGDTVAMVTVEGVECSEDTVKDGSYKIQRPFVFVTNKSVTLSEQAQAFVDFATSKDAADLIRTAGAVPVNE